ncbi:MAG: tautomerase family protein [Actinobacteria bacterium]|nr:tautomerase family protein [Actinomycetota bacterium]
MPYIDVHTNSESGDTEQALDRLIGAVADALGKPRTITSSAVSRGPLRFKDSGDPAAWAHVWSLEPITDDQARKLTQDLATLLSELFGVPADRIWVVISGVPRNRWGTATGLMSDR